MHCFVQFLWLGYQEFFWPVRILLRLMRLYALEDSQSAFLIPHIPVLLKKHEKYQIIP